MARDLIQLVCQECKRKNYSTTKNKRRTPDKLEFKKFCNHCRAHTLHREGK
jgi:large subunit ribosomal protein L33